MAPGIGPQYLRGGKREALAKEEEEKEYLPKELVAWVDVSEEEPENEYDSESDRTTSSRSHTGQRTPSRSSVGKVGKPVRDAMRLLEYG